jgi:TP901 family phage tail tape measure protein
MADFANLVLGVDTSGLKRGERDLKSFGAQGERTERKIDKFGGSAKRSFNTVALAATAALGAIVSVGSAVRIIAEFETSMSRLGAVSRATAGQLESLRDIAKDLGSTTEFSASQAADGLNFLAMAGFNATEAMAAIPSVLDLATASGLGLAEAADTASNIMSGFGIAAADAAEVADVLAAASTRANTTVGQLGAAMSTVAPIASALDMSLEDTAAAIGVLSDAGIQGERAGTGLRGVLASLAGPTTQAEAVLRGLGLTIADVDPATNDLSVVMGRLGAAGLSTADAMTLFGREAASGALVLIDGAQRVGEFGDELGRANGAAQTMAATMRDNLGGDLKGAASAAQGLAIALGDAGLTAAIRMVVQGITAMVRGITAAIDFVGDFRGYFIAAALTLTAVYTPAIIAATVATASWIASMIALRGALVATGIGALIVGAGLLINQLILLVEKVGSLGLSFGLLADVAVGVWDKIKAGGEVLLLGLQITFNNINNSFVETLGKMAQGWAKFSDSIAETNIGEMMGLEGGNVRATEIKYGAILNDIAEAQFELNGALGEAKGRLTATTAGMDELRAAMADANEETENGVDETAALAAELEGVVNAIDGSGGAAGALNNAEDAAIAAADAFNDKLSTAVDSLASAFGDFVASGFQDFKGMVDNILSSFKSMISQMIATAIANPIKLAMGIGGGGAAGAVASGLGGGGGILGSALGGLSALSGGIGSGVAVAVNGIMAGGGLGPAMGAISGGLGMGGAAGIGTAIGAVAVPLLAVAAAFSFFKKKTTELETGMRISVDGMDTLVESYKKVQTSRFFGLSKKVADEFAVLDGATADPIRDVVRDLQQGVANAAASLGVGAEVFDGFSRSFTLNLKGLTDQEAQAALAAELQFTQDAFANMIPTLTDFKVEGESTMGTLTRLISNITSANAVMSILGLRMFDLTLSGANAASVFNDAFGSLENLNAISTNYYQKAYTDVERVGAATGSMSVAMSELGVVMPKTIAGFRNLIEQADRMGQMDKVADLLILFGDFANIVDAQAAIDATAVATAQQNLATATTALKAAFSREMEATRDTFAAKIDALQESLTGAREKLANSRAIANALSDALDNRLFPSVEAQRQSQDAAAGYLASLVGSPINDADALQLALKTVADPSKDTYATLEDYRRDFNMTSGVIASLEKTAGFALSADEQAVLLLEQQIADTQLQSDQAVDLLQQQLDGILGIGESMLSLADAIKGFAAASAVVAGAAGNTAGANTSGTSDTLADVMSAGLATEQAYLTNNPDVSAAVANGTFVSGYDHYQQYGNFEGRSYAGGGYTGKGSRTGGLDGQGGFMAMMHPQETVIDHTRGSANAKLEAQLDVLNSRIEQLTAYQKQTTINTGNTSFDLKDIRRNGVQVEPVTGAIFKTDEVA